MRVNPFSTVSGILRRLTSSVGEARLKPRPPATSEREASAERSTNRYSPPGDASPLASAEHLVLFWCPTAALSDVFLLHPIDVELLSARDDLVERFVVVERFGC